MNNPTVYLSLGSNQGDSLAQLKQALILLSHHAGFTHVRTSDFYSTPPFEMESTTWFTNAVCSFQTSLTPREIFKITQAIEIQLGKVLKPKNADRPIDIDFLFYSDLIIQENDLKIPHPRWKERLFVLIPLSDLTQEIVLCGKAGIECYVLQDLIQSCKEIASREKS